MFSESYNNISLAVNPIVQDKKQNMMQAKIYPESHVELRNFTAKNYDNIMNIGTLGFYRGFIKKAIQHMDIQADDHILDLGCGTGRNAKLMCRYLNEKGCITGLDISEHMKRQFQHNLKNNTQAEFIKQRIDVPFQLQKSFDKVFISFVLHGFPHEIRSIVIRNAYNHLIPDGQFFILDFAEFDINKMPRFYRLIFQIIECKYAFDFIKRDWKEILNKHHFDHFIQHTYVKNYVCLLSAQKNG